MPPHPATAQAPHRTAPQPSLPAAPAVPAVGELQFRGHTRHHQTRLNGTWLSPVPRAPDRLDHHEGTRP
jgi:hypothetical protein